MLSIENLNFKRGDREILKDISLSVPFNSGLIVKGANGAGKTTLLRIIAQLLEMTGGEMLINGEKIKDRLEEFLNSLLYIGHKHAMKDDISVLENLLFWAGIKNNELLVPAAINYFGLDDYAGLPFKKLSEGLKKKAALARLLACESSIWILDEPYTNLDKEAINKLNGLVSARVEHGGMVILSTHHETNLPFKEITLN